MPNDALLITLAQPNPDESDTFRSYVTASTELALDAGGEVSSRFGVRQILGATEAAVFGLATFPSAQAITDMFTSTAYRALIPARETGISCVNAYTVTDTSLTELPEPAGEAVYLVTVAAQNADASDDLANYQHVVGPLAAKHGARPIAQLPVSGQPVGDTPASFVAIAEFPSSGAVEALLGDSSYLAVIEARDRALQSLNLYVTTT